MKHSSLMLVTLLALINVVLADEFSVLFDVALRSDLSVKYSGAANFFHSGSKWSVEGISQAPNGDIYEYTKLGKTFVYTFKNSSDCTKIPIAGPPLLIELGKALKHATPFDKNATILDKEVNKCAKSNAIMYLVSFANEPYVLCGYMNESSIIPERIIGTDLLMTFTNYKMGLSDQIKMYHNTLKKCKYLAKMEPLTDTEDVSDNLYKKALLSDAWFTKYSESCHLTWTRHSKKCSRHVQALSDSAEDKKVCIFLHGAGHYEEVGEPVNTKFPLYWGKVHKYTPQCSERWFIRENTKENGWNNVEIQKKYCALALIGQQNTKMIKNKIIFAHSMGSLILAAAIHNKICDIDTATSSWYASQAPLRGSKGANVLSKICSGERNNVFDKVLRFIAVIGKYCMKDTKSMYPVYEELVGKYFCQAPLCIHDIEKIAGKKMKGVMCGTSPHGLFTQYTAALGALADVVNYGEKNDGLVPLSSCIGVIPEGQYRTDPSDDYYVSKINHADGTCRNGNGLFGNNRKPCSWFTNKI
jgi:hypothetical protein